MDANWFTWGWEIVQNKFAFYNRAKEIDFVIRLGGGGGVKKGIEKNKYYWNIKLFSA